MGLGRRESARRARGGEHFNQCSLILTRRPVAISFEIHLLTLSCLVEALRRETPAGRWVKRYGVLKTCIFSRCYFTRISKTFKKGVLCYWLIWMEKKGLDVPNKTCALLELLCDVWRYEQLTLSATSDRSELITGVCCRKILHFIVKFAQF